MSDVASGRSDDNDEPREISVPTPDQLDLRKIDNQLGVQNGDTATSLPRGEYDIVALPASGIERKVLSRRTTRESVPRTSSYQTSTSQLLSSLMAESSSDEDGHSSASEDFDLRPPTGNMQPPSMESFSELLFSAEYLTALLHHSTFLAQFRTFVYRYLPSAHGDLIQYIETSKAIAAIEYANAIAASNLDSSTQDSSTGVIAKLDPAFEQNHRSTFQSLLSTTLPLYVTYNLVKVVSDCLHSEITGKINHSMRHLVGGLSEVFCLTDPNQDDNPIVFASREFYRFTGYDRDEVIGHNCRFLQGARTNRESPSRIRQSLDEGNEVSETLLNYRRNGRPFINLLMLAPLYDNDGKVRYHIGAQVDVTGLVERGQALESFDHFLKQRDFDRHKAGWTKMMTSRGDEPTQKHVALEKLKNLSELFDEEETSVVHSASRHGSTEKAFMSTKLSNEETETSQGTMRDLNANDGVRGITEMQLDDSWNLSVNGPRGFSGKLPGVYEKYMLVRPAPSLRIVFASSRLQAWGTFVKNSLMSHLAADQGTLTGLLDCFQLGTPVTAKVCLMLQRSKNRQGTIIHSANTEERLKQSKSCWIAATPLLGSDDNVGVWMVVLVEHLKGSDRNERQGVFGRLIGQPEANQVNQRVLRRQSYHRALSNDLPIKPKRLDGHETQPVHFQDLDHAPVMKKSHEDTGMDSAVQVIQHRSSPSPVANQSRKASPRQQPLKTPPLSPSHRVNRRRLPASSDDESSSTELQ